jgi:hypothetical protein
MSEKYDVDKDQLDQHAFMYVGWQCAMPARDMQATPRGGVGLKNITSREVNAPGALHSTTLDRVSQSLRYQKMASKVFIVTGASRGIGLAVAKHLLKTSGNRVMAISRSLAELQLLKDQFPTQVEILAEDMTQPEVRHPTA